MWIVRLALRRPYTFVVAAMLAIILAVVMYLRTPTDIFPNINIPIISVIFNYSGMSADDMSNRIVRPFERILGTTVNDIEHIESQSLNGISVIKMQFQPKAKIEEAVAQVTAVSQTAIRSMPPGTQPPLILQFSASSVPILQLSLGSDTMPEAKLFDNAVQVPPSAIGHHPRRADSLSVRRASSARSSWTSIPKSSPPTAFRPRTSPTPSTPRTSSCRPAPPRSAREEYPVRLNSSPATVAALNELPIRTVNGTTIRLCDIGPVRDGFTVQTNIVHANGKRGVLLSIYKPGNASTLDVVDSVQGGPAADSEVTASRGGLLKITPDVRSVPLRAGLALTGVMKEGRHRRRPDRPDDPALPGLLAQHADRHDLHPAVHPRSRSSCCPSWAKRSTS